MFHDFAPGSAPRFHTLKQRFPEILEDAENRLPMAFRELVDSLANHLPELNRQAEDITQRNESAQQTNLLSRLPAQIPGIGPLIATAPLAAIGDIKSFAYVRQLAA